MTRLVTGANRGVGLGLVQAMAAEGGPVIGTHRGEAPAPLAGVEWQGLDVREPASMRALAARLAGRPLSLLVCNAGIYPDRGQRLEDGYGPDLWAEGFAVNVTGVFLTIQALLPNLRAGRGKIAIISSRMGADSRAPGGSYIYRASKAAALNLGRNLAVDLRPDGIPVGIYHPGWVQTDMGGTGADITMGEAATGLLARFHALNAATTGCFETWDGQAHPF